MPEWHGIVLHSGYKDARNLVDHVKGFLGHDMLSEGEKKTLMLMRAFASEFDFGYYKKGQMVC